MTDLNTDNDKNNQIVPLDAQIAFFMQEMAHSKDIEITPYAGPLDFGDKSNYSKLNLSPNQKSQLSMLQQAGIMGVSAGTMATAYTVRFPEGLPHVLTKFNTGGYSTMIHGADGIIGHASYHPMVLQSALLGVFTSMSVITGQYFLAQINSELKTINQKLDDILGFLYGDKKAELLAEVSFVKYAYQNYSSIMAHEQQRTATIASLHQSKKIAINDIEFYLHDLENIIDNKKLSVLEKSKRVLNCKKCLDLSEQVYVMSCLLEVYFSQNFDSDYLGYLEDDMKQFLAKCNGHLQVSFGGIRAQLVGEKDSLMRKFSKSDIDKFDEQLKKIGDIIDSSANGEKSFIEKTLQSALNSPTQETTYIFTNTGDTYFKKA